MLQYLILAAQLPRSVVLHESDGRCIAQLVVGRSFIATEDSLISEPRILRITLDGRTKGKVKSSDAGAIYGVYGGGAAVQPDTKGPLYDFNPRALRVSSRANQRLLSVGDAILRRSVAREIFGRIPQLDKWDDVRLWNRSAFVLQGSTLSFWKRGRKIFSSETQATMLIDPVGDKMMAAEYGGRFTIWSMESGKRVSSGRVSADAHFLPLFHAATSRYFVCADMYSFSAVTPDGKVKYLWTSPGVGFREVIAGPNSVIASTKAEQVFRVDLP